MKVLREELIDNRAVVKQPAGVHYKKALLKRMHNLQRLQRWEQSDSGFCLESG